MLKSGDWQLLAIFSLYFEKKQQQLKLSFSIPTKDKDGKNLEIEFPVNTQEDLKNPSKPSQDDDITNEYNKARPCLKVSFPDDYIYRLKVQILFLGVHYIPDQ